MVYKPRIIQHTAGFDKLGGTTTELNSILFSRLGKDYQFEIVSQKRPAGGINIKLILEMACDMRKLHPDIVHVRGLQNEGFHGVLAAYVAGYRNILVAVHGFAEDASVRSPVRKWILSHVFEPLTLLLARRVYCVCKAGAEKQTIQHFAKDKSRVIYNGIDTTTPIIHNQFLRQQLGATDSERVVLFAGRISRDKGLFILSDALKKMKNPPIVWIAGDGPDIESLKRYFGSLIDTGKVKMLGRRDDVPALLSACDFFVLPSYYENFSMALLEAMRAQRPVIATNVGGNPELIIDGITGILVPPNDSDALAGYLTYFSDHPEICTEMGKKGRERVEHSFSIEQMVSNLKNLYDEMLDQKIIP